MACTISTGMTRDETLCSVHQKTSKSRTILSLVVNSASISLNTQDNRLVPCQDVLMSRLASRLLGRTIAYQ